MSGTTNSGQVPRLRFPEFREAEDWKQESLARFALIAMGSSPRSEYYNENRHGLPLLQGNADIKNRLSMPRIFTSEITKECHIGDILLSVRAPVGHVAKSIHHACIGRGIAAIRAKEPNLQEFLYQWLLSYESLWASISQGGTFDAINRDDLWQLGLTIPSHAEQQKIADCLSSLDDLITLEAQKLDSLKAHKKGLMQQLFPREGETQPPLRFPEFQNAGEWEETTIGALGNFYYGKSAPKWSLEDNASTPCVRYGELYTKFGPIITETFSRTNIDPITLRFSKGGEILIPRVGEKPEDFGKCCCYLPLKGIAIGEMISVLETTQYALFYTYYFRHIYRQFAVVVEGQNVKNLYYAVLQPLAICRPPILEQQRIASCLTSLDDLITAQTQKLEALKTHKKGLMQQLFPQVSEE